MPIDERQARDAAERGVWDARYGEFQARGTGPNEAPEAREVYVRAYQDEMNHVLDEILDGRASPRRPVPAPAPGTARPGAPGPRR